MTQLPLAFLDQHGDRLELNPSDPTSLHMRGGSKKDLILVTVEILSEYQRSSERHSDEEARTQRPTRSESCSGKSTFLQHASTRPEPVGGVFAVRTNLDGMRGTFVHVGIEHTLRKRGTVYLQRFANLCGKCIAENLSARNCRCQDPELVSVSELQAGRVTLAL